MLFFFLSPQVFALVRGAIPPVCMFLFTNVSIVLFLEQFLYFVLLCTSCTHVCSYLSHKTTLRFHLPLFCHFCPIDSSAFVSIKLLRSKVHINGCVSGFSRRLHEMSKWKWSKMKSHLVKLITNPPLGEKESVQQ